MIDNYNNPSPGQPLTKRERDTTGLAASGMLNKHIAEALGIGERTVKQHLSRAYKKLGCRNRVSMANVLIEEKMGILGLEDLVLTPWEVPPDVEFAEADNIHVKTIRFRGDLPSVGDQHMHAHEHVSVVVGPFRVFIGDEHGIPMDAEHFDIGDRGQPCTIRVPAHRFHRFVSLRPGGILLCISNHHGTQGQVIEKYAEVKG